ncbi:MAG: hypothetical protein ACRERC_06355, partial [Candidatus Binatia bacterium]
GEACDGADAPACPGQCDAACACPAPCTGGDLLSPRVRADAARFKFRSRVFNGLGTFIGADPRDGFRLALRQGAATLTIDIPAGDAGWIPPRPGHRRFKWAGDHDGVTRIVAVDRSAVSGLWKVILVGRAVPGAAGIDADLPIEAELTIGSACMRDVF